MERISLGFCHLIFFRMEAEIYSYYENSEAKSDRLRSYNTLWHWSNVKISKTRYYTSFHISFRLVHLMQTICCGNFSILIQYRLKTFSSFTVSESLDNPNSHGMVAHIHSRMFS